MIKDNVQERHDFDAGNKACSMKMTSIMKRTEQRSWQQYSKNCHSEQGAANAAVVITATRPTTSSVARVFFRGQLLSGVGPLTAATTDAVGTTSATPGAATCTSWNTNSSPHAFDDFFIEVIGTGAGGVTVSSGVVWGNHYLSQPVFSQTITT